MKNHVTRSVTTYPSYHAPPTTIKPKYTRTHTDTTALTPPVTVRQVKSSLLEEVATLHAIAETNTSLEENLVKLQVNIRRYSKIFLRANLSRVLTLGPIEYTR